MSDDHDDIGPRRSTAEPPSVDELLKTSRWDKRLELARARREKVLADKRARGEVVEGRTKRLKPWEMDEVRPVPMAPTRKSMPARRKEGLETEPPKGRASGAMPLGPPLEARPRPSPAPPAKPAPATKPLFADLDTQPEQKREGRRRATLYVWFTVGVALAGLLFVYADPRTSELVADVVPQGEVSPPVAVTSAPDDGETLTEAGVVTPGVIEAGDETELSPDVTAGAGPSMTPILDPTPALPDIFYPAASPSTVQTPSTAPRFDTSSRLTPNGTERSFPVVSAEASVPEVSASRELALTATTDEDRNAIALPRTLSSPTSVRAPLTLSSAPASDAGGLGVRVALSTATLGRLPADQALALPVLPRPAPGASRVPRPSGLAAPRLSDDLAEAVTGSAPGVVDLVGFPIASLAATPEGSRSLEGDQTLPRPVLPPPNLARTAFPLIDPRDDVLISSRGTVAPTPPIIPPAAPRRDVVVVHLLSPRNGDENRRDLVAEDLGSLGYQIRTPAPVPVTIRETQVRFYHPEDADAAALISDTAGARLRDFTNFSPAPALGTIELWLEGEAPPPPPAPARRVAQPPPQPPQPQGFCFRGEPGAPGSIRVPIVNGRCAWP